MLDRRRFVQGWGLMAAGAAVAGKSRAREQGRAVEVEKLLADPAAAAAAIRAGAAKVMEGSRVESELGMFHAPSASTYRAFFAWDSGWNIISMMHLDAEQALEELATVCNVQAADGHIPHEVNIPGYKEKEIGRIAVKYVVRRQYDNGKSRFIDPPSFLIAAGLLFERSGDARVLKLTPALERCAEYLTGPRDLFGDGLVSIIHPWESGTDSAPIFDQPMGTDVHSPLFALEEAYKYPKLLNDCAALDWDLKRIAAQNEFVFEDVGMNALTAAGLTGLATLCEGAGDAAGAEKWRGRAGDMVAAMEEHFWDDASGFFYPRYDLKNPKTAKRTCLTGLTPLITGLVHEDKAHRVIEQYLLSPNEFSAPFLVPFNSVSEMAAEKVPLAASMLWRGPCIWANMNWLAARAAASYGREDVARKITRSTAALILGSGFREFYDPATGQGEGAEKFTWPCLALDMMERHGIG